MTGASWSDSIALRAASRSSASSPRVELTKTRRRWSGVRIMRSVQRNLRRPREPAFAAALNRPMVGRMEQVRLAELVGALSLGIDLGFGQPMEHVLRQCLIALRLADQMGLDDRERTTVYYTALLVNVGCHTDSYEQAKWFGDDLALRATKFDHEPKSVSEAATMVRMIGAGTSP